MAFLRRIRTLARRLSRHPDPRHRYAAHIEIDPSAILFPTFILDLRAPIAHRTYARVGKDCMIDGRLVFESTEGQVEFGPRVFFGGGTILCRTRVTFGSDVFVAWGTYFYDHDSHSLDFRERRNDMRRQLDDYLLNSHGQSCWVTIYGCARRKEHEWPKAR
jgi:acetyltransferase-like isoleucine patch superfamily enzyme